MKAKKISYYVSTGLLSLMMLLSVGMYFFNHEEIATVFESLNYPTYLIYPLAIAKLTGILAIWTKVRSNLVEWAYAGFFFNFILAAAAHVNIADGEFGGAIMAMALLLISYNTRDFQESNE